MFVITFLIAITHKFLLQRIWYFLLFQLAIAICEILKNNKLSAQLKKFVDLFKGCGCGQSPKYCPFTQSFDSQTACCLAAWTNRRKPMREQQKKIYFILISNAMRWLFLAFLFIMTTACFVKLCFTHADSRLSVA